MATQNKRTNTNPCKEGRSPIKKAKMQIVEKTEDPMAQKLAPILEALASSDKTAASCDTLQAALPYCLDGPKEERHSFQIQIIELTTAALKGLEEEAAEGLAKAEEAAEKFRVELASAQADRDSKQAAAAAKKQECDTKALEVESFGKDVEAAKTAVKAEVAKKDAFLASKTALGEEQEAFQKVLEELWQPLKANAFAGGFAWRKREKACTDLVEKLASLSLEESLVEALKATLKLKVEQRGTFAQATLSLVEEEFGKHQASLANRVAGLADEEAARDASIAEAEANLTIAQGKLSEQDKDDIALQNNWVDLENLANKAKTTAEKLDTQTQSALEEVTTWKTAVDACIGHSASFAALCDPPVTEAVAANEEGSELAVAGAMEVEAENVAIAA